METRAYRMRDCKVIQDNMVESGQPWPGKHVHVHVWWELENGYAVGWNENPSRGWSFPVVKMPKEPKESGGV